MRGGGEGGVWMVLALIALCAPPALVGSADQAIPTSPQEELVIDAHCPVSHGRSDLSLIHVTKENGLPGDYVPRNLVDIEKTVSSAEEVCVTSPTALALSNLFAAAAKDGVILQVFSGYRSPDDQTSIARKWRALEGPMVDRAVAPPSYSEHQTGTAVDLTGASIEYVKAHNGFENTPEYAWLTANAWKYGFNMSYPKTLKDGSFGEYRFEPWHWRYVGVATAAQLHTYGLSYNEISTLSIAQLSPAASEQESDVHLDQ